MFHLLDKTLSDLLDSAPTNGVVNWIRVAEKRFDTPDKVFATQQNDMTINLFLYEVKENRELRQTAPNKVSNNGQGGNRRAPLRVDCAYMVTAWSNISTEDNTANAHQLLGQAFFWLSRFPKIPEKYLTDAGLTGQLFDAPTMVAQMDGAKSAGEFWSALGIPPRPYFNLIVTICMDLEQQIEDRIVTTVASRYLQAGEPSSVEEFLIIGGTVRDPSGKTTFADAWVKLESANPLHSQMQVTDAQGRFVFDRVPRGLSYTLRARAVGFNEAELPDIEVPSLSGSYDLVIT